MPPAGAANNRLLHSLQLPDHSSLPPAVPNMMPDEETLTEQTVTDDTGNDTRPSAPPPVCYDA